MKGRHKFKSCENCNFQFDEILFKNEDDNSFQLNLKKRYEFNRLACYK